MLPCHRTAARLYCSITSIISCPAVEVCSLSELKASNAKCFVIHDRCRNHRWGGGVKNFYSHCLYDVNDSLDKTTSFDVKLKIHNL